jgi:hypothetical protein
MDSQNVFARWFGRVVLLGVAANILLGLPSLLYPNAVLALLHLPQSLENPLWASFSSLLLLLLSAFYVPAGLDPERYRASALLAVLARLAGFAFFVLRPTDYGLFGYYDLSFAIPQGILLALSLRAPRVAATAAVKEVRDVDVPA